MGIFASILGIIGGKVGERIMGVVDKNVKDKDLRERLKHELDMSALLSGAELRKIELEAERDLRVEIEKTHQAEMNQADLYTKRTRPKIARQSWVLAGVYAGATIFGRLVDPFITSDLSTLAFDPVAFGTLAGPALWYMGMRGFDKWKHNEVR
jgi:hypothetical protein